ncbi:hypothetical protein BVC80_263g1 [Macleaya cordata]|uniref:Transposase MuDR plant domain-containing protein n=1 Tax=Macleaya cordata TaxID=56857 RepID=A0A200Q5J8_MACCD|nr:hypothetical protein BVC80_263g1 [Macleaya cordata]
MDFEILAVFCYGRESIAFRIGLCSTIGQVNKFLCQKWSSLSPLSIELSFLRDGKKNLIETDAELQSLAAYVFAKKLNTFDIIVGVVESACNALVYSEACNSSSSCVQNYDEQGEVRQPLKSSYWATLLDSVGQTFPGGAEQFRTTLLKYSIETGFKVYMLKNDKSRVKAVCGMKDVTGCKWRVHASCPLNHPSLFKIKRLNSAHTCGSGFRDSRNPPMTKKLVKSLILNQVRDKPLIKPKEIVDIFKSDYGVTLGYYFAYAGKELALKKIYGDDKLSYSNLRWFADSLIRTNPGSRVVLEVNPVTNKFERLFISFEACIHGFEFCRPLLFLDGTFLKSKYKGYLLAATGKNGNEVATIEPPDTRKGPGRPRVNRIPNTGSSSKRARLCSRCRTYGHHNRSTCAAEI